MGLAAALLASLLAAPDFTVELGRRLFMDPTVSRTGKVSCSSCHQPEHGFSDPQARSRDENGSATRRRSQPILDLKGSRALHWDGEFASIRELIDARLEPAWRTPLIAGVARVRRFEEARALGRDPDEKRFRDAVAGLQPYGGRGLRRHEPVTLVRRLADDGRYDLGFRAAFGTREVTAARIADALEAYVLSLRSGTSPFDRGALTDAQRSGFELFKANCAACHLADGKRPRFTDGAFHDTGIANSSGGACGLCDVDLGAGGVNFVAADARKFKTPSLRDVARRAPYMHDGSLGTLEDVVRYYNGGGFGGRVLDPHVRHLGLSDGEVGSLVDFLHALTSDERPGLGPAWQKPRRARIRIVHLEGHPIRGLEVEIRPAGDRLGSAVPAPLALPLTGVRGDGGVRTAVTDASGCVSFDFPSWTHVRLVAKAFEIHYDRLIPDLVASMEVMAAPKATVALRLRLPCGCRPEGLDALVRGCDAPPNVAASFELVRRLPDGSAVYIAASRKPSRRLGQIIVADLRSTGPGGAVVARQREIDLAGGWAEPLDVRPDPGEPAPDCCGTGCD